MATTARSDVASARARPAEVRSVRVGAAVLFVVVVSLISGLWMDGEPLIDWSSLPWLALVFLSSVLPVGEQQGSPYLILDLPILLACSFVLGPASAGLIALLGATSPQELRGRMSISRLVWNHSQIAMSVIAAGLVFMGLGGDSREWPAVLLVAELALVADAAINYFLVALIYSLASGQQIRSVVRTLFIGTPRFFAVFYLGLGIVAAMMAALYIHIGISALLVFLIPVAIATETLRQTISASGARRDLAARREALRCVDERIAEERADERGRIAEALHDDVLQRIFDVTIRAHVIRECYRSGRLLELEQSVPDLVAASERVADELRDVINGLRHSQVGHAGLLGSLVLLSDHLRDRSGIRFVTDFEPGLQVRPEVELVLYQIAREALVNATTHSRADTVWLSLSRIDGAIELRVLDNGVGFDPKVRIDRHFGLELMNERASNVGGELSVESSSGNGTLVVGRFSG
jgi:signal transduction histidine kinase